MENTSQKKWYDNTGLVIVLCILFFPVGLYALWKSSVISKGWKIAATVIIAFVTIAAVNSNNKNSNSTSPETKAAEAETAPVKEEAATPANWSYSDEVDKMSSEKIVYAECQALTTVEFEFPYNGGSTFELILRKKENKTDLILTVSKGQFISSFGDGVVRIKFDDEKPITVGYSSPTDGSSTTIFIGQTQEVISRLKTAKKLIIEAEFFQAGRKQIEFNTEGLKWDSK